MNFPAIASNPHWPRTKRNGTAWGDVLSTFNIGLGGIALMYILDNTLVSLYSACALIFVIMALDGLDGMVARRTRSTPMGPYLDSISDGIGFVLAPSLLVYSVFYIPGRPSFSEPVNGIVVAVGGMYIATGFYRLARFAMGPKRKDFKGAPVSVVALAVITLFGIGAEWWMVLGTMVLGIVSTLSTLSYPKLRGKLLVGGCAAVILGVTGFAFKIGGEHALANSIFFILLCLNLAYGLSPLWWKPSNRKERSIGCVHGKFQERKGAKRPNTIFLRRKDAHD